MHWRHEQLSLRMALAAATHHSAQPRAKEWVEDAPRRQKPPPPGTRPASLAEPRGDVVRVQRHTVEHLADGAPCLPTLDVPVPQMVDQPVDILKIIAKLSPAIEEQVIDVPKIIQDPTPQRLEPSEPQQLVEQLVEVPVPSFDQCTRMAFFRDDGGRRWCLLTGPEPGRFSWWLVETEHEQENPPPGITASPGRYTNTVHGGSYLFGVGLPEEYLCGFSSGRRRLDLFPCSAHCLVRQ